MSWTQEIPVISLEFIHGFGLQKDAAILDVGGGESRLVDFLLDEGYCNLTVLDISEEGIKRTQQRLGTRAVKVKWIVSDIADFKPHRKYDFWHDRATFHFLTSKEQIGQYVSNAATNINSNGVMLIGTFSEAGPTSCSGLDVKQYAEPDLENTLIAYFRKIRCIHQDHVTPFKTVQNFLFCSFKRVA